MLEPEDVELGAVVINRDTLLRLITTEKLIEGYIDLDTQLTPHGFDLTVCRVGTLSGQGSLDFSNKQRQLPESSPLAPLKDDPADAYGWWMLKPGVYKLESNETCRFPNDLIGIARSRSSLLRMGACVHTAVWDAGFCGQSEFLLTVHNPAGLRLKENARVAQLIFLKAQKVSQGYQGIYQHDQHKSRPCKKCA